MEVPVLSKGDSPTFIDVSSKASARLPLQSEKSTNAIGLEEPSFLTLDARLVFTKIGSNFTKLMIENYWPLLKSLRIGRLQARAWAPVRFAGLKSFLDATFGLIIDKAKLMELLRPERGGRSLSQEYSNPLLSTVIASRRQRLWCIYPLFLFL